MYWSNGDRWREKTFYQGRSDGISLLTHVSLRKLYIRAIGLLSVVDDSNVYCRESCKHLAMIAVLLVVTRCPDKI